MVDNLEYFSNRRNSAIRTCRSAVDMYGGGKNQNERTLSCSLGLLMSEKGTLCPGGKEKLASLAAFFAALIKRHNKTKQTSQHEKNTPQKLLFSCFLFFLPTNDPPVPHHFPLLPAPHLSFDG